MTESSEDAVAFRRFLRGSTPEVTAIALGLRAAILDTVPGAIEWFDPGNGLLAIGSRRSMRDLQFAIVPHRAHVNLQLVDGVDLPNPDGRIRRPNGTRMHRRNSAGTIGP